MLPPRPVDHAPLYSLGFHELSIADLEKDCVDAFPLSTTRKAIMANLKSFIEHLQVLGALGELWIDGSFVTEKIDPQDVDILFKYEADLYNDHQNSGLRDAVDWVGINQKKNLLCDSYTLASYPVGHDLYAEGEWWYSYWHVKWGFNRQERPKGIVVIPLSGMSS